MKRIISLLLSTMIVLSVFLFSETPAMAADQGDVSSFVTRMYSVCLDREPDTAGLKDWTNKLKNHEATGVSAAYGFIFSDEFQNKQCTNEQYVTYMYSAFFGRKPDSDGLNTWVKLLNDGATREYVFCGFANSVEFDNLCNSYGIIRGYHIEGQNFMQVGMVNLFVERLYNEVLDRSCDSKGMENWTTLLVDHTYSGSEVAAGFVFSEEFINKHLCNSCYLDTLYQAFMGRSADSAGKSMWMDLLDSGMNREDVFNGFAGSEEFNSICESYGISNGTMTFTDAGTYASGSCTRCGVVNPEKTPSTTKPTTTAKPTSATKPTAKPTTTAKPTNVAKPSVTAKPTAKPTVTTKPTTKPTNTSTPTPDTSKPKYDEKGHALYPGVPGGGAVDPNKNGFSKEYCAYHDTYHIYYFDKGLVDPNFNGYKTIDGNTYFIKYYTPHAYPCCSADTFLWVSFTNDRHYMDENGIMVKDTVIRVDNVWYKVNADGYVVDYEGWQTIEGNKYHYSKNTYYSSYYSTATIMDRGIEKVDGKIYYFAKTGELQEITGWKEVDGKWYYFEADHTAKTGWKQVKDKWYYFGSDGAWIEYNGWQLINDKYYYFKDGVWVKKTSWQSINNKWYYFDSDGNMKTRWIQDPDRDNNWYYLGDDGVMRTGIIDLDGDRYILRDNGQLVIGWYKDDRYWYYSGANGKVCTGWTQIKGDWYYFGEESYNKGHMRIGWFEYGDAEYYFQDNGVMLVGWNDYGSSYYGSDGKRIINDWYKIDGDWYYFGSYGYKYTDCFHEGYWLDKNGAAHDGWVDVRDNDSWIYIDPETHKMASGWKQIGEYWYYFDPEPYYNGAHLMVTDTQYITDSKGVRHEYYFDSQGRAQCGFVELYSLTYYFDPVTYAMVVDDYFYTNGKWYYAGPNGRIYSHYERTKDGYLTDMDGEVIGYPGK